MSDCLDWYDGEFWCDGRYWKQFRRLEFEYVRIIAEGVADIPLTVMRSGERER